MTVREITQRIDVESADDRRVQALEIEDQHIIEHAGAGAQNDASGSSFHGQRIDTEGGGDPTPLVQCLDVEVLEGGDAGPGQLRCHPDQDTTAQGELEQAGLGENPVHQPGILQAVGAKLFGLFPIQALDSPDTVLPLLQLDSFSISQNRAGHRLQTVIFEGFRGGSHDTHPIPHLPSRNDDTASPALALG